MKIRSFLTLVLGAINLVYGQAISEEQQIIDRLNIEATVEPACSNKEFRLENCTISYSLSCGEDRFELSFHLNDIARIYKDKADLEDTFETLFFECRDGVDCISSVDNKIPPLPVFPIRLPKDGNSTLGDDAIRVFSKTIGNCN